MTSGTKTRLTTGLVLATVFGAGMAVGFSLDRTVALADAGVEEEHEVAPEEAPRNWIIDQVGLTEHQRLQVDSVVDHFQGKMADLQAELRPQAQRLYAEMRDAFRAVLSEEQVAEYDRLLEERRARRAAGDESAN